MPASFSDTSYSLPTELCSNPRGTIIKMQHIVLHHFNVTITTFYCGKLFSGARNKTTTVGNAVKGPQYTACFLLSSSLRPRQISTVSLLSPSFNRIHITRLSRSELVFHSANYTAKTKLELRKKKCSLSSNVPASKEEALYEESSREARDKTPDFGVKL